MQVLCVILANTANTKLLKMTQTAVSAMKNQVGHDVTVVVVESGKPHKYEGASFVQYSGLGFNYNKAMKQGIKRGFEISERYDYIVMANNDIEPRPDCLLKLLEHNPDSASPKDPTLIYHKPYTGITFGYRTTYVLCGWFIAMRFDVFRHIGIDSLLPDEIEYWYQDNWISDMLKVHGHNHCLVADALCVHLGSQSESLLGNKAHMTEGQRKAYDNLKRKYGI
jgi:GT2 family glycosyltransferase